MRLPVLSPGTPSIKRARRFVFFNQHFVSKWPSGCSQCIGRRQREITAKGMKLGQWIVCSEVLMPTVCTAVSHLYVPGVSVLSLHT